MFGYCFKDEKRKKGLIKHYERVSDEWLIEERREWLEIFNLLRRQKYLTKKDIERLFDTALIVSVISDEIRKRIKKGKIQRLF